MGNEKIAYADMPDASWRVFLGHDNSLKKLVCIARFPTNFGFLASIRAAIVSGI